MCRSVMIFEDPRGPSKKRFQSSDPWRTHMEAVEPFYALII
jgi:hypothetical protein